MYVPCNHDPETLFKVEESPKIIENSVNLHLYLEIIKDDLLLVDIGGNTCGISSKEEFYHSYRDLDTKSINGKDIHILITMIRLIMKKSEEMFKKDLDKIDSAVNKYK